MPQAFGDIYLGETFSAFVSLANKAAVELQHVVLRVEVRTDNNREPIREERAIDRCVVALCSRCIVVTLPHDRHGTGDGPVLVTTAARVLDGCAAAPYPPAARSFQCLCPRFGFRLPTGRFSFGHIDQPAARPSHRPPRPSRCRLPVRGTLDKIVKYELKDTGMHILSCLALYTDPQGERKQFKKFYKFQVSCAFTETRWHTTWRRLRGIFRLGAARPARGWWARLPAGGGGTKERWRALSDAAAP